MTQTKREKRSAGRPTRKESQKLDEQLRKVALSLFLEQGYDAVSMDSIADKAGITKRTLYTRYKDKMGLFTAVLEWARVQQREFEIDIKPNPNLPLEDELTMAAEAILRHELDPTTVKLTRMAAALYNRQPNQEEHSHSFYSHQSDLGKNNYSLAWSPRIKAIEAILRRREENEEVAIEDMEVTAELFLSLITGNPTRLAEFGYFYGEEYEKKRIREAVKMLLARIQPRTTLTFSVTL